jgi:hypothetical protein
VRAARRASAGAAAAPSRRAPGFLLADEGERALQRLHQALDAGLDLAALGAHAVDFALHLFDARLRLLDDASARVSASRSMLLRLLGGLVPDLVGHLLRGEQRVAEVALLAAVLGQHGLELGHFLPQPLGLAQRVLVVVGHLGEERR